jgi:hypothetical protein
MAYDTYNNTYRVRNGTNFITKYNNTYQVGSGGGTSQSTGGGRIVLISNAIDIQGRVDANGLPVDQELSIDIGRE